MSQRARILVGVVALIGLFLIMAAGCRQSPTPEATATPTFTPTFTPTPDPAVMLREAGQAMQALESVRFEMSRSGGPVFFDPDGQLVFNSAIGQYAAPDGVRAVIRVMGPGITLEINTIALGDEQWLTNPLTRRWEKLPAGWGFNPAALFDPELGWEPLLRDDVTVLTGPAAVDLNGQPHYRFEVKAVGPRLPVITAGLVQDQAIDLTIWLQQSSRLISQLQFETGGGESEASQWQLTFSEFNEPVTITPPE
jgi:lipoprotein LprG